MRNLQISIFKVQQLRKFTAAVIILLITLLIFLSYSDRNLDGHLPEAFLKKTKPVSFLINTTNCKIPDLDPLNSDVSPFVKKEEYRSCSDKPLLTYIETKGDIVKLKVNQSVISLYSTLSYQCCLSKILRKEGDKKVIHSDCEWFQEEVTLTYQYVRVTCTNFMGIFYRNVHVAIIPELLKDKISAHSNLTNPLKIFMLGIDSVSRLNLQRSMPKSFLYLEKNFIGFRGYNKMDDNTFPNLMAILTGRNMDTLAPNCLAYMTFDNCDIIWKPLQENGFITAFAEDEPFLNTFNYYRKGFVQPPTDFYLRSYFLSAYLLPMMYRHLMGVCSGPENTAERILNFAKNFIITFKDNPTFSFFWMNSFSHDDVNLPSSMDDKLIKFFDTEFEDALNNSVVIFFSDHGFRFGNIRFTYSGWLEERLPFVYFKFPKTFQESHPKFYENFIFNAHNRLTTPYDLHMTLQHLLKLSNDSYDIKQSPGCPSCQSLFIGKIQDNRSCTDGGIPKHYCTCEGYNSISSKSHMALKVGQYIVDQVNQLVQNSDKEGYKCAKYELDSIETVGKSTKNFDSYETDEANYLILIKTKPYAMFEATVRYYHDNFQLLGDISRLNSYKAYTGCINSGALKKYCFCNNWFAKTVSAICSYFQCPF